MLAKGNRIPQTSVWQRTYFNGVPLSPDCFGKVGDKLIKLEEYTDLGQNMYGYIFLICEQRKLPVSVKFRSVQILQRFLKAKNQ